MLLSQYLAIDNCEGEALKREKKRERERESEFSQVQSFRQTGGARIANFNSETKGKENS